MKRITWATELGKQAVANGVEYITASGQLAKVGVRKEVVLSASTFRNPLILEASGVGNPRSVCPFRRPPRDYTDLEY